MGNLFRRAMLVMASFLIAASPLSVRAESTETVDVYRLYNPNSGEHFYTTGANERDALRKAGWWYEGVGWKASSAGTAVNRLYNPYVGDHFYTESEAEKTALLKAGWKDEGVSFYAPNRGYYTYRLYNPNARTGAHHYTLSDSEKAALIKLGWRDEGIGWRVADYGYKDELAISDEAARANAGKSARYNAYKNIAGVQGKMSDEGRVSIPSINWSQPVSSDYARYGTAQKIVDKANLAWLHDYPSFTYLGDHASQGFRILRNVKQGDYLYWNRNGDIHRYRLVKLEKGYYSNGMAYDADHNGVFSESGYPKRSGIDFIAQTCDGNRVWLAYWKLAD